MVLEQIGAGLLDQNDLYAEIQSHSKIETSWYSGPDGLSWTLNHYRPASLTNYFALFELANEDAISRRIVWTIEHYGVAPVALVSGCDHWIVVSGYEATSAPTSASDRSYEITAFDVNFPWPPTPSFAPPPPHSAGDVCGSGGIRGVANKHIAYSTWQCDYMTGVPVGHWAGKYLAITACPISVCF
jgi:hypothetical protein